MKATTWPAEVQPQADALISADEFELFLRDDKCGGDFASIQAAISQSNRAAFEFRKAIGAPTDF